MIDIFVQTIIVITSPLAVFLVGRKNKWGFVVGLLSQPFWFYTTWQNQQWGAFLTAIVFTVSWMNGIYYWFFKNNQPVKVLS